MLLSERHIGRGRSASLVPKAALRDASRLTTSDLDLNQLVTHLFQDQDQNYATPQDPPREPASSVGHLKLIGILTPLPRSDLRPLQALPTWPPNRQCLEVYRLRSSPARLICPADEQRGALQSLPTWSDGAYYALA